MDLSLLALEKTDKAWSWCFWWSQPKGSSVVVLKGPPGSSSFPSLAFCKWAPSFYLHALHILKVDFSIMYCILSNSLDSLRVFISLYETSLSDVPPGRMGWEIQWVSFWRAGPSLVRDGRWGWKNLPHVSSVHVRIKAPSQETLTGQSRGLAQNRQLWGQSIRWTEWKDCCCCCCC